MTNDSTLRLRTPLTPLALAISLSVALAPGAAAAAPLPAAAGTVEAALAPAPAHAGEGRAAPRNLVLVTIDGVRCEEVFGPGREARLPFLWQVMAQEGQVLGDASRGSHLRVSNGTERSYPGYAELLTGVVDPRIRNNDPVVNPNPTVLEWLDAAPDLRGQVAALGGWDLLPVILGGDRSKVRVVAGGKDAAMQAAALEELRTRAPRVLYVMLNETDDWAHQGEDELYLDALHRADAFLARLWTTLQELPQYRGRTTLVVTTDHGRGSGGDWSRHGHEVPGSEAIWLAALGPDTPALGVRANVDGVEAQVAATIAALLGRDWRARVPAAAPPLPGVAGPPRGVTATVSAPRS
jgi:hypothetical protein